jgi:hypothetical protein
LLYDKIAIVAYIRQQVKNVMSKFLKQLLKIRMIHCKRYGFAGLIIYALGSLFGAYSIIVLKVPLIPEQRGAEPVLAGICIMMFFMALGFAYWHLFKEKNFYLAGQYKKYEMSGNDPEINQTIKLSGSGEYDLIIEVIWKVRKEDIPPDQSFHLARWRKDNGVRAHIGMEIVLDNSSRQFLRFEQRPDQSLNAGKNGVGKTLDKVAVTCEEKITINVTAKIERKEKLAIEHEETFLIRVYNSLNLQEAFQQFPSEISFS